MNVSPLAKGVAPCRTSRFVGIFTDASGVAGTFPVTIRRSFMALAKGVAGIKTKRKVLPDTTAPACRHQLFVAKNPECEGRN
jgi:hypothetical protein